MDGIVLPGKPESREGQVGGGLSSGLILFRSDSPGQDGTAKKRRPTLSRTIYLPRRAILVTVIVFPSAATSPVNWTFAPAFATSAAKF